VGLMLIAHQLIENEPQQDAEQVEITAVRLCDSSDSKIGGSSVRNLSFHIKPDKIAHNFP
jgi:hypothetical protein